MGRALAILCTLIGIGTPARVNADPPSYLHEIVPLLTRQGCNQGACHGKGAGQNGFRLSLRGYAPADDHRYLTREYAGRRLDPSHPENSILLTKPTGQAPHEGGVLFSVNSREYHTLAAWLRAGAPGPEKDAPQITRFELRPEQQQLKLGQQAQLQAFAHFSDGNVKDVTWLTKFESNDPGLVSVTPNGQVTANREGETAIRAAYLTEVAIATFTIPYETTIADSKYSHPNNPIDTAVYAKLKALRIEPSGISSDQEFIRRVFLDTIGTLPTAEEAQAFADDRRPNKRAIWIDTLLDRPEFVDYWTLILADLFQNRKERDHDVRGVKGVRSFHVWLRQQVAQNRPWDQLVGDVLTATGDVTKQPGVGYYLVTIGEYREAEKSEVVASVAQAFLGTRIGCAQCHNHPLERYTQDDYYHFAGFFSPVKLDRRDPKEGITYLRISAQDPQQNARPAGVIQPRTGQFLHPQPLDRSTPRISPNEDPRVKLVEWMTDSKNTMFSGAMVNRIWKHYLGVGLVEPVDDLRATNPPSNRELWDVLNRSFVNHKFNLKQLMREILNSQTYQLTSATRPGNAQETRYYSHYYARRLPAEVLLDAISASTGVPESFDGYPVGMRAVQLPDTVPNSYFLNTFGKSNRVTACACERSGEVTMPQLLHLQAGDNLAAKIRAADGKLANWLKTIPNDDDLIHALYWATLSRSATAEERSQLLRLRASGNVPRDEYFRDLFWAILNSKAFSFNH
ncbi:DUF1549 and DUF1553 domain-containing protein [Tuwongella immobilis]|uniref:BIG2 domain-containing protein n=1 Tax=Tuwongella immobilis TaxID=692036 RepID=A0A6C2YUF3_9BACT|nr:DUF1549 and DUF1553 domain-containing protein [Tuwongella immobilis]VIP05250.1 Uncharacterized protein OS=Planctomyces maris DSM 8797 GN=PM8797T_24626 PE=4 SV=1: Big_2: PSCyt2: PSD1 [Tuwongella immobilis]VTS07856.1 Uncharacterized protein OS=Planctomyces maris DSM 8797 GN=PM8797T_24626 PE=4 SV=1: Big_2: PSCyt2: PSD1 [Tuwongella immobilis]